MVSHPQHLAPHGRPGAYDLHAAACYHVTAARRHVTIAWHHVGATCHHATAATQVLQPWQLRPEGGRLCVLPRP